MSSPSPLFFLRLLQNSITLKRIHQIHAQILIHGLHSLHNHLLLKLVSLKSIANARFVFEQMPTPNEFSWNYMIKAYSISGPYQDSLSLYSQMLQKEILPSKFTYPFVFKACSSLYAIELGQQVHTHVMKFGFDCDLFVNNSLIDMYSKCACIGYARRVLDEMHQRDEVSWNSIISGYVWSGDIETAHQLFDVVPVRRNVVCWTALINGYGRKGMVVEMLSLFLQMLLSDEDVRPNSATMVCLLSACSAISNFELGKWVSVFIDVNKIPLDIILSTALIDMYSKCGDTGKARRIFNGISNKNLVTWNAMITGYVHGGLPEEAMRLFDLMRVNCMRPNEITLVNLISACATLGALERGREVHLYLGRSGLELNVILATALVDMYSKCGCIGDACLVFAKMSKKDMVLWNAMIMALAVHGHGRDSLSVFAQMQRDGNQPNDITYIGVLSACTHSGLVQEGRRNFETMIEYGLNPKLEHYACMVDLLGRAGYIQEAISLVRSMTVEPDSIIWGSLLNACSIHRNVDVADEVGKIILSSKDPNLGCCILLANIYASRNRWTDVARVRKLIKETGMKKPSGCSWIEVDGIVHMFLVEDTAHPQSQDINKMNKLLINQSRFEGYAPSLDFVQIQCS